MSEMSAHFLEDKPRMNKAEMIVALIDEALADNEEAMKQILHPGEIGGVAIVGYQASNV